MSETVKSGQPKRLLHLDLLRILAIYLVVFNHTGNRGYMLFTVETESVLYFPYMLCSVFCKIAVPLFFMISGALLLKKQETLKQLFSKRVLRMVVVLLLVSVPYYYWLHRSQGMGIADCFTYIYGNSATTSLWYLYSYIALLLLLPFLRCMVQTMKQQDYIYLFLGHLALVGILPSLEYLLWEGNVTVHESFAPFIFIEQNVFFAMIGYYLEHVFDEKKYNKKYIVWSIVLSVISLAVACGMTHCLALKEGVGDTERLQMFFKAFIAIPTVSIYLLAKFSSHKIKSEKVQKALGALGSAVFGVYLIEKILRSVTNAVYVLLVPFLGSFVAALVWCFATCCLAFLIILSLKHIPCLKKIVNKFI